MSKIRVYELARELGIESKILLVKIKDLGIVVSSHQSALASAQVEKIRAACGEKKNVVVRRRKASPTASDEISQDTDVAENSASIEDRETSFVDGESRGFSETKARESHDGSQELHHDYNEIHKVSKNAKDLDLAIKHKSEESTFSPSESGSKDKSQLQEQALSQEIAAYMEAKGAEKEEKPLNPFVKRPITQVKSQAQIISRHKPEEPIVPKSVPQNIPRSILNTQNVPSASNIKAPVKEIEKQGSQVVLRNTQNISSNNEKPLAQSTLKDDKTTKLDSRTVSIDGSKIEVPSSLDNVLSARKRSIEYSAKNEDRNPPRPRQDFRNNRFPGNNINQTGPTGVQPPRPPLDNKKTFGATIVRRATPEESKATMLSEEFRGQKGVKKEDPAARRVTSSANFRSSRPGFTPDNNNRDSSSPSSSGPRHAFSTAPFIPQIPFAGDDFKGEFDLETGKRREKKDFRKKDEEDKDKLAKVVAPVLNKRKALSTRDLIDKAFLPEDEEVVFVDEEIVRKKRVVFTPNAASKKRDLKRRRDLKSTPLTTPRAAYRVVKMEEPEISVAELAKQMSLKAAEIIKKLMNQGMMVTLNQKIDFDTATLLATEFGYECKLVAKTVENIIAESSAADTGDLSDKRRNRPPIITIMGHVDHGKTSILDVIRKTHVAAKEAGGITQHIGAYTIVWNDTKMSFLDTPGHAAFSAMRARGSNLTDIVVLVVAADDGVMPQTIEAISHAREAKVPIIVAINKMDKRNINLDRVYNELSEYGVQSEDWGGENQFIKVSALKNEGIDELLEAIHVQAEMMELKADYDKPAEGVVIEAHLDKGRGPVATVMITSGTLRPQDIMVAGTVTGKVRAMLDHNRIPLKMVEPSTPTEIIGLDEVPMAGDKFHVVSDEKVAKQIIDLRLSQARAAQVKKQMTSSLEELLNKVNSQELPNLDLIVKGDVQGSVEAICDAITKLDSKKVNTNIIHRGVGGITESDLSLAKTSGAVVLGFNVRAQRQLQEEADKNGVVVKYFSIIYELIDMVKSLMVGKLPPVNKEVVLGHAEVRNPISVPRVGIVAGSIVTDGKITRASMLRLIRNQVVIYTGKISSLKRFKDDVKEVMHGYECGISFDGYNDIREGDVIEAYIIEEIAAQLDI